MFLQCLDGAIDSLLESGVVRQILADLLSVVGVKDHAYDAASPSFVKGSDLRVEVLTQVLLLSIGVTTHCDQLGRNSTCAWLLLRHRHGHSSKRLLGLTTEGGEAALVDGDTLLLLLCTVKFGAWIVLPVVLLVLLLVYKYK